MHGSLSFFHKSAHSSIVIMKVIYIYYILYIYMTSLPLIIPGIERNSLSNYKTASQSADRRITAAQIVYTATTARNKEIYRLTKQ